MEGMREKPLEILGGFELLRLLDLFFDQAIYFSTLGYESHWKAQHQAAVEHLARAS
jgi:hypothetical protein